LGSIDPYQAFRIFYEILFFEWETGKRADVAFMIDQSHNLKGKIEATIQTVNMAQELFARARSLPSRPCSKKPKKKRGQVSIY
jgi:L-rhamnose isomerase/sugar isomerase